jgi:epoxide hydrolase 4
MSSDFVRYSSKIEIFDPKLSEYVTRVIEFCDTNVRESPTREGTGRAVRGAHAKTIGEELFAVKTATQTPVRNPLLSTYWTMRRYATMSPRSASLRLRRTSCMTRRRTTSNNSKIALREAAMSTVENRLSSELREGYAEIGEQRLHYVEAGEGPLIVLLHGFPEFWYGWRQQIEPLAAAGFRVVAPDTRGYNLSSKPDGVQAYDAGQLADDIRGLIKERGAETGMLVGHDWGGTIAWTTAMHHPEVVDRLAILNAAHPRKLSQGLQHHPDQLRRSWYFFFFNIPDLPETVVHANHWHFFRHFLRDADPEYTPEEIERYIEAWSQPGAATGMINYYRSSVRTPLKQAEEQIRPIAAPTLVIWGEQDRYLRDDLAEPEHNDVPNLDRVERLPNASHWVHHDEPERVNQLLVDFFRAT